MSKIVVAKLFRLGKNGDKFSKEFKTIVRSTAKIDEDQIAKENLIWEKTGLLWEIDEKATKERESNLSKKQPLKQVEIDRQLLIDEAISLGLEFPKNIPTEKLLEKITEAKQNQ